MATVNYVAYDQTNPKTGKKELRCGRIVNKRTLKGVELAQKYQEMGIGTGIATKVFAGIIDAVPTANRSLVLDGYEVWDGMTITRMKMQGQLGKNDSIGDKTEVYLDISPRSDMKVTKADVDSFVNVSSSVAKVEIDNVSWNGSTVPGEIKKDENILATGTNLMFNADIGDKITFEYGGETIACTVDGSGYQMISVAWPAELSEAAVGTEVAFTFTLHGGKADVNPKVITKTVKIVG